MSGDMFDDKNYPTQWAFNPATYQNMNSDEVDWAALAQQWIKLKESAVSTVPPAPPPPPIVGSLPATSLNDGGEVPMDMETKDDDIPPAPPAPTISGTEGWNQWNQWGNQQWNQGTATTNLGNWEWSNIHEEADRKSLRIPNVSNNPLIPPPAPAISQCTPYANQCIAQPPMQQIPLSHSYSYNVLPPTQPHFNNQVPSCEFWTNAESMHKDHNRIPYGSIPNHALIDVSASKNRAIRDKTPEEEVPLDQAKRRQLPAWIREGLEKMEREKQKAVEREQMEILRKKELEARKLSEEQALAVLNPAKSKFDSDSDNEATENESNDENNIKKKNNLLDKENSDTHSPDYIHTRKSRFRDATSPAKSNSDRETLATDKNDKITDKTSNSVVSLTKEQILENIMLKVRRSLTEILLEVTNDEIASVCKDFWKRFHSKGSTGKITLNAPVGSTSLSQLSTKLGLGIYSDSNSESDEDNALPNEPAQQQSLHENDSEEELMEVLRRKQRAFQATEAEIEARLAQDERNSSNDNDDDNCEKENSDSDNRNNDHYPHERKKNDKHRGSLNYEKDNKKDNLSKSEDPHSNSSTYYGGKNIESHSKKDNSARDGDRASSITSKLIAISENPVSSSSEESKAKLKRKSNDEDDSSDSQAESQYSEHKRKNRHRSKEKNNKSVSDSNRRRSSSESRSRSKSKYSSRENSCETKSSSKMDTRTSNRSKRNRSKSRSTSRSRRRRRSDSRSRSKSSTRSKTKHRRSRSRSRSRSHRKRYNSSHHKSRSRRKTRAYSRSSDSRSRSRSSRRRSRSTHSRKSNVTEREGSVTRRRTSRSRSNDRSRRSKSKSRSSKSYHRDRSHRDRSSKKSSRH